MSDKNKLHRTLSTVTAASGPNERHPWFSYAGNIPSWADGRKHHVDPAAVAAGLRPAVGDPIYLVSESFEVISFGRPVSRIRFVGVEDSRRHALLSTGKGAWRMPLNEMATRQLLKVLAQSRVGYSEEEGGGPRDYTTEEIKAELAKRPHIPTGEEAKAIRRAKTGGGRGHTHGRAEKVRS